MSDLVTSVLAVSMIAASFWAVIVRYRRGDATERQQIKLLAAAVALEVCLFFASAAQTEASGTAAIVSDLSNLGLILIPIAIGIAILRYRLYDIDRIISRTISWALVTGLLVACFAGLVIGLTSLLGSLAGATRSRSPARPSSSSRSSSRCGDGSRWRSTGASIEPDMTRDAPPMPLPSAFATTSTWPRSRATCWASSSAASSRRPSPSGPATSRAV